MNIKIDNRQKYSLQLAAKQREVGELQRQYSTLQVEYSRCAPGSDAEVERYAALLRGEHSQRVTR